MGQNSERLGEVFRQRMRDGVSSERLALVRGKGLMNALVLNEEGAFTAHNVAVRLKDAGLLCKPTHGNILRVTPPLCINESQLIECTDILTRTLLSRF